MTTSAKKTEIITRKQYMDSSEDLHRPYFAQFVDKTIKSEVLQFIGKDRLLKSKDKHLNDIPLHLWDSLTGFVFRGSQMVQQPHSIRKELLDKLKTANEGVSCAGLVCIYKEAAKQIIEGK